MRNEARLQSAIFTFADKIENKEFVNIAVDKVVNTVEIVNFNCLLNPDQPLLKFGDIKQSNEAYIEKELKWYISEDLNIEQVKDVAIWRDVASSNNEINSNYGWLIYNEKNYNQYDNCLNHLIRNKNSRHAIMLYSRPSIHYDYNKDGMNDFICTISNHFLIRDNKLISIYHMRSNDFIYGFFNDFAWACFVYKSMYNELKKTYVDLQIGELHWNANSFHVYERHFPLILKLKEYIIYNI